MTFFQNSLEHCIIINIMVMYISSKVTFMYFQILLFKFSLTLALHVC